MSTTTKLTAAAALVAAGIVSYLYLSNEQVRASDQIGGLKQSNAALEKRIWDADQMGRKLEADIKSAQDEAEKAKVKTFPDPPIRVYPGTRDISNLDLSNLTPAKKLSMAQIQDSYKPIIDALNLPADKAEILVYHLSDWGGANFDGFNAALRDGIDVFGDPLMLELFRAAARDDSVQAARELLGAEDYAKLVQWTASSPYRAATNQLWALKNQLQRDKADGLDDTQSSQVLQAFMASAPPNGGAPGVPVSSLKFTDPIIAGLSSVLSPAQIESATKLAASQAKAAATQAAQVQKAQALVSQLK